MLDEGLPLHPLHEQRETVRDWRQVGCGIFGLADMLIKMGIRYGSEESIELCDKIGFIMAQQALITSSELGCKYGSYPNYDSECISKSEFFKANTYSDFERSAILADGLRNSQLLTIAPTGSLSSMLGVSGGIEPIFANYYERKTESLHGHDEYYKVYTPIVKEYMDKNNISDDKDLPDFFVTAQNLNYRERINMQSIWQKHIDASISSTVNVPNDFTVDEVKDLYMYAWKKGLKGVTIFRDGCKRLGILTTDKKEDKVEESSNSYNDINTLPRGAIIKADDNCIGKKRTLITGCGTLHVSAFFDPATGDLLETYFSKGSTGGCALFSVGLSRMISLAARGGVDIYSIVDQLKSSGVCPSYAVRNATKHDTSKGTCCPVAIGNALLDMYNEIKEELGFDSSDEEIVIIEKTADPVVNKEIKNPCPECGAELTFTGGCNSCPECGYTKCD